MEFEVMGLKVKCCRIIRLCVDKGVKLYIIELFYENGEINRGLKVPFTAVTGKNQIKRFPSVNKARDWLNSRTGLSYLENHFRK